MATTMCRVTGNISDLGLTYAQGYVLRVIPDPRTVVVGDKTVTLADIASAVVGPTGQVQFTVPADAYLTIIPTINGTTLPGVKMRAPVRDTASLVSCIVMSPPVPADIQTLINVVQDAATNTGDDRDVVEEIAGAFGGIANLNTIATQVATQASQVNTQTAQVASNKAATDTNAAAAQAARTGAEAARDVATATLLSSSGYTAATIAFAITAGIAGVADGAYFAASGDDVDYVDVRRRAGAGSTLLWSVPKTTVLGRTSSVGPDPANTGTTAAGLQLNIERTPAVADDVWASLEVAVNVGGPVTLAIVEMSGNNAVTIVRSAVFTAVPGVNTFFLGWPLAAGQYRAVQVPAAQGLKYLANTPGYAVWTSGSALTAGMTLTPSTQHTYQMKFTSQSALLGRVRINELGIATLRTDVDTMLPVVGRSGSIGWANIVATGTSGPARTVLLADATTEERTLRKLRVGMATASPVVAFVATISAAAIATIRAAIQVEAAVGVNTINLSGLTQRPGEFVGIAATGIRFQASANPTGQQYYDGVGSATPTVGQTVTLASQHRWEFAFDWGTGLQASSGASALPAGTGLDGLATADNSGNTDATAILAAARAAHPQPYVRPGTFAVTAVPNAGEGLHGPGHIALAGDAFFIPSAARLGNLHDSGRAALMEHIAANNVLILFSDSRGHFAYAANGADHWFNRLTRYLNLGVSLEEPIMTALRPSSTYTPAFYGVTVSGGTTGNIGPLSESLILADGGYLEFIGACEDVEVWARQASGAGTLTLTRDGVTIGNKSYAGAAALDVYSAFPPTGNAASATYRITATGGSVEITGLLRDAPATALTGVGKKRLRTLRASHGSYQFQSFSQAAITSMMTMAAQWGGVGVPIIDLGINDQFSLPAATIVTHASTQIDRFEAAGAPEIFGILPPRPAATWLASYQVSRFYDDAVGALRRLYRQRGVIPLGVDNIAWRDSSGLSDGLHYGPGEPQRRKARGVLENIIKAKGM